MLESGVPTRIWLQSLHRKPANHNCHRKTLRESNRFPQGPCDQHYGGKRSDCVNADQEQSRWPSNLPPPICIEVGRFRPLAVEPLSVFPDHNISRTSRVMRGG